MRRHFGIHRGECAFSPMVARTIHHRQAPRPRRPRRPPPSHRDQQRTTHARRGGMGRLPRVRGYRRRHPRRGLTTCAHRPGRSTPSASTRRRTSARSRRRTRASRTGDVVSASSRCASRHPVRFHGAQQRRRMQKCRMIWLVGSGGYAATRLKSKSELHQACCLMFAMSTACQ